MYDTVITGMNISQSNQVLNAISGVTWSRLIANKLQATFLQY